MYIRIKDGLVVTRDSKRGKEYLEEKAKVNKAKETAADLVAQDKYFSEVDKLQAEAKATLDAFKK